jgi:hypothetical protein
MIETLTLLSLEDLVATLVPASRGAALCAVGLFAFVLRRGHVRRMHALRTKMAEVERLLERHAALALLDEGFTVEEVGRLCSIRRHDATPPSTARRTWYASRRRRTLPPWRPR